jgi:hypothetical protein
MSEMRLFKTGDLMKMGNIFALFALGLGEKEMRRLMLTVLCLSIFATTAGWAGTIQTAQINGLAWLILNQTGDGSWRDSSGLEVAQTAAGVEALLNAGITKGNTFSTAVAWLQNYQAYSTDALSRQVIALAKAGRVTTGLTSQLISWRNQEVNPPSTWGAYNQYSTSYPDTSLALAAIIASGANYPQAGYSVCYIVSQQNADYGWPYFVPPTGVQPSVITATVYSLLALNNFKTSSCGSTAISTVISNGVSWLKNQQLSGFGGGFGQGTTATLLETALAYRALITVTTQGSADPAVVNAQNYLIGQQQPNGSWGPNDPLVTSLILASVPATVLADANNDGIPDALETSSLLGINSTGTGAGIAAAGKSLAKSNGMSVAGSTTAVSLASALLNSPYSASIAASGSAPYTIISGRLPDGLSLSAATISGTPTAVGTFDFVYQTTVSGAVVSIASQIQVTASPTQVPALPDWAMLLLALLLMLTLKHVGKHATSVNS